MEKQHPNKRPRIDEAALQAQQPITRQAEIQFGDDDDDDEFAGPIPCDTSAALSLLKHEFPKVPGVPPFATNHQLYTVLNDKTLADRELDELKHSNTIRMFKLPTTGADAILLTEDYKNIITASKTAVTSSSAKMQVFDWFIEKVLPAHCEAIIMHDELVSLLQQGNPNKTAIDDGHINLLLQACCLTRHTGAGNSGGSCYLFSIPGAGPAVRGTMNGNKELLDALKKKKHPEMLESKLMQLKLKKSPLGMKWHLRDLLGSGDLIKLKTTVGDLIRVDNTSSNKRIR